MEFFRGSIGGSILIRVLDFALCVLVERSIVSYEIFEAIAEEFFMFYLVWSVRVTIFLWHHIGNDVDMSMIFACMYTVYSYL